MGDVKATGVDWGSEHGDVDCRVYGEWRGGVLHIERVFHVYQGGRAPGPDQPSVSGQQAKPDKKE
jgi:hypothetical protein